MYLGMVYEARVDVSVLDCGSHRNSLSNHMTPDPRFITYTTHLDRMGNNPVIPKQYQGSQGGQQLILEMA